jgi:myxalamid-type polyketide synthase MxaE and MxaD
MSDAGASRINTDEMSQFGVRAISVDEGTAFFEAALARPEGVLAFLPIDWSMFREARRGRHKPLYLAIPEANASPDGGSQSGEVLRSLRTASGVDRRTQIEALVRRVLSGVLRRPAASIAAHQSFGSLGVDSLMALEIRNRLQMALEQPLSATLAWNYPNIESLSEYVHALFAQAIAASVTPEPALHSGVEAGAPELSLDTIASLSDDDALRALRKAP